MKNYSELLVIGDSLSGLARDNSCFAFELVKISDFYIVPIVYSYSGYTSSQILFEASRIFPIYRGKVKEVLIQFGTNDAKDEVNTSLADFEANVKLMQKLGYGFRCYFMTIPEPKGFGSPGYTNGILDRIKAYNKIILRTCVNCIVTPKLGAEHFADGIHFSRAGNIEIARTVWKKIKEVRTWK